MTTSGDAGTRKRTAAEIEADLLRTREELTRSVDDLSDRLDPRRQAQAVKEQAKTLADGATNRAKSFVDHVKAGDSKAVSIVGVAAAALAAIVGLSVIRRNR
ncbi:MAG: DUF3618 domain-containing protein [Actinomycetales bacterium]|nr:DUF3618 domain-containing protein [Actinomycetales bacterium]